MKDTPRENILKNERDRSSRWKVKILNLNELEVASPPKKRAEKARAMKSNKVTGNRAEASSCGNRFQQRSGNSAPKSLDTKDLIKKWYIMLKRTPDIISDRPEEASKRMLLSNLDDRLSSKLPTVYTDSPMSVNVINRSWFMNCHSTSFFRSMGTDGKYEHIILLLFALLMGDTEWENGFSSKQSARFLQGNAMGKQRYRCG